MRYTTKQLQELYARNPKLNPEYKVGGAHPEQEKPSLPRRERKVVDRQGGKAEDDQPRKRYRVRFVFQVSDNKKRDGFGMSETVADALINAVKRFIG